jgi:type VI protein secretion system component Hcp
MNWPYPGLLIPGGSSPAAGYIDVSREFSIQEAGMGASKKSRKAEKTKSAKARNLAKRELDVREAATVRGGRSPSDLQIRKVVDKSTPVLFR